MPSDTVGVEERYAVFPFYLCLDVSASMSGDPIDGVNAQMPALRHAIGEDPAIAEVIRFGVITFSDVARTVLPLSDLSMVEEVPAVAAQGRTSYAVGVRAPALQHRGRLPRQPGGRRPVVPPGRAVRVRRPPDRRRGAVAVRAPAPGQPRPGSATPTSWRSASATPTPRCSRW